MQPLNTAQRREIDTGTQPPAEAQAQGGGEVVAGTSKATLHRDRAGCEWFIVTSDESPDDESEVTPSDDPALFAFLKAVTTPPSAPVGVEAIKSAIAELDALRNAMFKTYAAAANGADKTKLTRLIEAERDAYESHYSLPKLQEALAQPQGGA